MFSMEFGGIQGSKMLLVGHFQAVEQRDGGVHGLLLVTEFLNPRVIHAQLDWRILVGCSISHKIHIPEVCYKIIPILAFPILICPSSSWNLPKIQLQQGIQGFTTASPACRGFIPKFLYAAAPGRRFRSNSLFLGSVGYGIRCYLSRAASACASFPLALRICHPGRARIKGNKSGGRRSTGRG